MASSTIRTPRGQSKVAKAAKIFCSMDGFERRFVIQRFMNDLDLTEKAASTYYQNCRKQAGMVQSRVAASTK